MAWTLQQHSAAWVTDQSVVEVLLDSPLQYSIRSNSQSAPKGDLFSLEISPWDHELPLNIEPLACGDAFVRESDLIASYPQTAPWTFGYQIDLRAWDEPVDRVRCMEVWLSISTSMLESNPKLVLRPSVPMNFQVGSPISIAQHGKAVLIVHPLDLPDVTVDCLDRSSQVDHWDIFGGFMEKGVIRRARLLVAWSSDAVPVSAWDNVLNGFADSPLPLTA